MSSCEMGEMKECGGGVECDCRKAGGDDATVRWSKRESSEIEEDHSDEGSAGTCDTVRADKAAL